MPGRQQISLEYISLEKCLFQICKRHIIFCFTYRFDTYHLHNDNGELSHLPAPDQGDAVSLGQDPAAHLEANTEAGVEEAEEETRPEAALTW